LLGSILIDSTSLGVNHAREAKLDRLAARFEDLDDPSSGNAALHNFYTLLTIALCAVLCGGQDAVDMALFAKAKEPFLREFLELSVCL
jgi:DDE_Tnp_1-associated